MSIDASISIDFSAQPDCARPNRAQNTPPVLAAGLAARAAGDREGPQAGQRPRRARRRRVGTHLQHRLFFRGGTLSVGTLLS